MVGMQMTLSYSKYSTYDTCPRKYKYRYIDKLEDKKSHQMSRGTEIHNSVEEFLQGKTDRLHDAIHNHYASYFSMLRDLGAKPEEKFAVSQKWEPVAFDDPEAMVRGVIDIIMPPTETEVHVFELKTGREYADHVGQRHLYGTAALSLHPEVPEVIVTNIYLDQKTNKKEVYGRIFHEFMRNTWDGRFKRMLADDEFCATPSQSCNYCNFSKEKGGPCEF